MDENNKALMDASLANVWDNPTRLPDSFQWLQEGQSEAARAQYAFLLLKRQYVRVGVTLKHEDVPTSWAGWSWLFYLNTHEFVSQGKHAGMLQGALAEIVDFTRAFSGEFFASNLLEMVEPFIDRDPPRSKFLPLLPDKALEKMDEMQEILAERHEEELRRMDAMYY